MTDETQTVVDETETGATPPAEETNARTEDLDALLAQYTQETKSPPPATEAAAPEVTALKAEFDSLKGEVQQMRQMRFQQELSATVKAVKGDLDFISDKLAEAWLDAEAREDDRLQRAWLEKEKNPRAWQKIQGELSKKFQGQFSKMPDRNATEDREVVSALVRGNTSTKVPDDPAPDFASMSDAELYNWERKNVRN